MKRFLFRSALLLMACLPVVAEPLSQQEIKRAEEHLAKTRDAFIAATKGLTPEQWSYKPAPERWSVAEVAEHIASSEQFLLDLVKNQVMTSPARAKAADAETTDHFVLSAIADRTNKVKAPEPLMPNNRYGSPKEAVEQFTQKRAQAIAMLTSVEGMREHAMQSALGRELDAYQWLLLISAHTERHTKQIEEVKAEAGFPN